MDFALKCCSYAKKVSPIRGVIKGKAQPLLAALLFGSAVLAFNGGLRPLLLFDGIANAAELYASK